MSRALRARRETIGLLLLVVLVASAIACGAGATKDVAAAADARPVDDWFTDETVSSGVDFVHTNGMTGQFYFPEHVAPGVGMIDFDNDGDLDLFFVQGYPLGSGASDGRLARTGTGGRLFRNDLIVSADGRRTLRFTDATMSSHIVTHGYGMGVAVADVDNDGCADLFVTNFGPNELFRNNCDGTFTDVSKSVGTYEPGFSVSATFFDFDRDGWLDLFVGRYVDYRIDTHVVCRGVTGKPDYCSPHVYRAQPDRLYRNQGKGVFADVTSHAFRGGEFGPALGAVAADFDGDGWPDLFVANDGEPNELWVSQRDGTFRNRARIAGVAVNGDGKAVAGMGVDAGDFDNDGDEDLFVTTLTTEMHALFVNDGHGAFEDQTIRAGLGAATLPYTGWGTAWFDADNDGRLDLLTVNGTIEAQAGAEGRPFPYDQRRQFFRNAGAGRFEDLSDQAGAVFRQSEVGRGAAFGDLDNDGAVDVVVANDNGPARVLINRKGAGSHWVGVRAVVGDRPRDAIGARVGVTGADGQTVWRRVRADGSYASANDPRVVVGLGHAQVTSMRVRVIWPDGANEEWSSVPVDRWTTLRKGTAR